MSEKIKHHMQANINDASLSMNEKILKECHSLYTDPSNGLSIIGDNVGLKLLPPRKKITVMIIGNHSAGKSSFINWYIEEHVLRTGVAIESQGFSFVTSGKKREILTGNATLHLFPHFETLREMDGVVDNLCTEVTTSKKKDFPLILFIDTPGLVDGDRKYPFDVNSALKCMGDLCDLVLVFFDPIGQALCKRTLDIVQKVNEFHPEKLRLFLSKADEAGQENDRQRVMMQIVQELCKRPGMSKTAFNMPTIYIPNSNKEIRCTNQIEDACKEISKTVNQTIQSTLDQLEKDCDSVSDQINCALRADMVAKTSNRKAKFKAMGLSLLGFLLPILLIFQTMVASAPRRVLNSLVGNNIAAAITHYMEPSTYYWKKLGNDRQMTILTITLVSSGVCLFLSRLLGQTRPTLQNTTKQVLLDGKDHLEQVVKPKKKKMYAQYLEQSIAD